MDAVEEAEQPRGPGFERRPLLMGPPYLQGASDQLVATGALHAVDAQVGATDPDRALGRPGPGRVVLGRHQTVTRVDRRGQGGTQVHVAEAQDEVRGVEHDLAHVVDTLQAVDAADELDVPRAPWRIVTHPGGVARRGLVRDRVVPGEGEVDRPARDLQLVGGRHAVLECRHGVEHAPERDRPADRNGPARSARPE